MSRYKAKPFRPLLVLDFRCDDCGEKLDVVMIGDSTLPRKVSKVFHEKCWQKRQAANYRPALAEPSKRVS